MYGNEASIRLSPGISTPSIRGISNYWGTLHGLNSRNWFSHAVQPCRCLCRGFLQTTRTTFFLFIILQLSQSRFTEGRTFIQIRPQGGQKNATRGDTSQERFALKIVLPLSERYPTFRQVVSRHLYHNFIPWQDPNKMQSHFSGDM